MQKRGLTRFFKFDSYSVSVGDESMPSILTLPGHTKIYFNPLRFDEVKKDIEEQRKQPLAFFIASSAK